MRSFVALQLNIAHNRCSVPGACALAYMMRLNASLTHLDATYNPLGEAGASALHRLNLPDLRFTPLITIPANAATLVFDADQLAGACAPPFPGIIRTLNGIIRTVGCIVSVPFWALCGPARGGPLFLAPARDPATSAPGPGHICTGTRPHLHRDSAQVHAESFEGVRALDRHSAVHPRKGYAGTLRALAVGVP